MNEQALFEILSDDKETAAQRYMRIFVGQPSTVALLRYEMLTGLFGPMSGALEGV